MGDITMAPPTLYYPFNERILWIHVQINQEFVFPNPSGWRRDCCSNLVQQFSLFGRCSHVFHNKWNRTRSQMQGSHWGSLFCVFLQRSDIHRVSLWGETDSEALRPQSPQENGQCSAMMERSEVMTSDPVCCIKQSEIKALVSDTECKKKSL